MTILVVDSAMADVQVAVFDRHAGRLLAAVVEEGARGKAEMVVPAMERALKAAGVKAAALQRLAVTVGPGSFTGLRIGIAAARGFAFAHDIPVVGLSTLAVLAASALGARFPGHVAAVVDARHGHLYFQLFGPDGRSVVRAAVVSLDDAVRKIGGSMVAIAGDAAEALADRLHRAGATQEISVDQRAAPDLLAIARLGAVADPATSLPRPVYLKAASADPPGKGIIPRA